MFHTQSNQCLIRWHCFSFREINKSPSLFRVLALLRQHWVDWRYTKPRLYARLTSSELFVLATLKCHHCTNYSFAMDIMSGTKIRITKFFIQTWAGSLIGNFVCGYTTVWKFNNFPDTLIFREINFGSFQMDKKCHVNNFEGFEF